MRLLLAHVEERRATPTAMASSFKRVCVFCGSNSGNKSAYGDASLELGRELVERKMELVYGGGSVGLMGLISKAVHEGGCRVIGVIPKALTAHEISGDTCGELRVVADMHERKAEMARLADAFIALPGGYGTLEELLEIITWSHLGIHDKPVGLLNVDGYYNSLLNLFDKFLEEGFIKSKSRHIVISAPTSKELIAKMEHRNMYQFTKLWLHVQVWKPKSLNKCISLVQFVLIILCISIYVFL